MPANHGFVAAARAARDRDASERVVALGIDAIQHNARTVEMGAERLQRQRTSANHGYGSDLVHGVAELLPHMSGGVRALALQYDDFENRRRRRVIGDPEVVGALLA